MTDELTTIPNVGPAVARYLRRVEIGAIADLRGRDPHELFDRLCAIDARGYDLCLLDTFVAAVAFANGAPARPGWEYSRERKARERAGAAEPDSSVVAPN
jgi:hypothetical protein